MTPVYPIGGRRLAMLRFSIRDLPFKHQLTLILTLTSCLALLVASAAFMFYDLYSYRLLMVRDLSTLAEVIGANSTAAIAFNDARAAEELLAALKAKPNVVAGLLYARDGSVFAGYTRDGGPLHVPPGGPELPGYRFAGEYLHLIKPIVLDGEVIGNVYIRSDILELRSRVQHYGIAVGLVLA